MHHRATGLEAAPDVSALPARELRSLCRRRLFAGARRHWSGPRPELRRAMSRFARRHRSDPDALRRALRAVASRSALSLLLLGLAPAAGGEFVDRSLHPRNPLRNFDAGFDSVPALADLDADGDFDAIVGNDAYGEFSFFENTGSAGAPAFVRRTGTRDPLDAFAVAYAAAPALVDLDADGDLDVVAGSDPGLFAFFENTGTASSPAFAPRSGAQNPLDGLGVGSNANPGFGDLDADGDLDLVSGNWNDGTFFYFENTGAPASPAFAARTGSSNPFEGFDVGFVSAPPWPTWMETATSISSRGTETVRSTSTRTPAPRRAPPS